MTTTDCYTIDTFNREPRFLLLPGADLPRLEGLAKYFRARQINGGYIFTPHRGMRFDRLYRAGFSAQGRCLLHPNIKGKKFTAGDAIHAVLMAEGIGA